MSPLTQPRYPVYIISKGRWESRLTSRHLELMRVPYRIVVEHQEREAYAAVIDPAKILVLDPAYQRDYDPCMTLEAGASKGSGPARNFVWDHAVATGAARHWIMDDNIGGFRRLHKGMRILVGDGTVLRCMEDFTDRYRNIALSGPNYAMFATTRFGGQLPPFVMNTRLFSCILIRNDLPVRWRARYNEDADLSIRLLKEGHCTMQFNAFLQNKMATQTMKGGNTDEIYKDGTLEKSRMLVRLHPDVAELKWKFNRWHHHVNYGVFKGNKLMRRPDLAVSAGVDNYGMELVRIAAPDPDARAS